MLQLAFPTYSLSAELPRWSVVGDLACYDFEQAKLLKLYEVGCRENEDLLGSYELKITLLERQARLYTLAVASYENAIAEYMEVGEEDAKMLRALEAEVAEEYEWSVRGGALYWVIAAGAVLFLAGGYAGYELGAR